MSDFPHFSDPQILAARPTRNPVDPRRPYACLVEPERSARGDIVDVATLFLVNRECPYRCLMCDLWKNTLAEPTAVGDIPAQIEWGLTQLPPAREIKLYNSGNFFDRQAIPTADYPVIADLVRGFDTVIVENHPNLCDRRCLEFRDLIAPAQLEIALGLETCHPDLLARLNKRMTLEDFDRATTFLHQEGIRTRVFLLLKPPFLGEDAGLDWALRSMDYAFDRGVNCCSVIPTRAGNGIMDQLLEDRQFIPPRGESLEQALEFGLAKNKGRVFVDLWDIAPLFPCNTCRSPRIERLHAMNLSQQPLPHHHCPVCRS